MTIVLREMTRDAADAILAGERPGGVRVAENHPTEFSVGVVQHVGAVGQLGPYVLQRSEDDLVVGEIVARSSMGTGRSRSATPWSSRSGTAGTRPQPSRRS
jgi:hypothetical protein